nr:MAG TPA: hypothetical protein [Caudoviricetes sp.]
MFKSAIKKVVDQYMNEYWYIKELSIARQKEKILEKVKEKIPSAFTVVDDLLNIPEDSVEIQNYLNKLPLLKRCFKFIRQEKITLEHFYMYLTTENREKFSEEAESLLNLILATEAEPYFKYIFETLPTREDRINDLFKEESKGV